MASLFLLWWTRLLLSYLQSFVEQACPAHPSGKVTQHDGNDQLHGGEDATLLPAEAEAAVEASKEHSLIPPSAAASEENSLTPQCEHFSHSYISLPAFDTSLHDNEGYAVDTPDGPFASHSLQEVVEEQMEFDLAERQPEKQDEKTEERASTASKPSPPSPPPGPEPAQLQTWSGNTLISECEPVGTQAKTVKNHLCNGLHQDLFEEWAPSEPSSLNITVETTTLVKTTIPAQERKKEKRDYYLSENSNTIHGRLRLCIYVLLPVLG